MASSPKTGAPDAPESPSRKPCLTLRYQVHRATREIFWKLEGAAACWDQIDASAAYRAVDDGEHTTPEFVGSLTKVAKDWTHDPGIRAIKLALEHALKTVHQALRDEPESFNVSIVIFCDNIKGLRFMRKAVASEGPENLRTWSGRPKPYPAVLEETFIVHQKIEQMLGPNLVKFKYKFPGGNTQPFFDQKVVMGKCKEILDQMQEEYYASRRWNQVSLFLLPFDCHRWLKGYCDRQPECGYLHRMGKLGTGIPPRPQKDTGSDKAATRKVNCKFWTKGKCFKGDACTFAHEGVGGIDQRPMCIYWEKGECFRGDGCGFRHGDVLADAEPECAEGDLCVRQEDVELGGDSGADEKHTSA